LENSVVKEEENQESKIDEEEVAEKRKYFEGVR